MFFIELKISSGYHRILCSNLEWTIDCFMLTLFSVIAIICCHIFTMCFVYKEPPSKGVVGSEKDLTQTQDITLATKMATTIGSFSQTTKISLHT